MKRRLFGIALAVALVFGLFAMFLPNAQAASQMLASEEIVNMIQSIEGFQAIPYWDYAQWTVGFGTECPAEDLERYRAEGIPVEEAQELFAYHMLRHEKAVNKFIDKYGLSLNQAQYDALISYTYNLGPNTLNKDTYTIVQAIASGATDNELIYAFSVYCMAGGQFQPGLMRRRLAEANLWLNGIYDDYPPESYCYVRYDANGGDRDTSAQGYDSNMAAVPMSRPTRDGYTFVGWYTQPEGGVKVTSLDETHHGMTLYAHWEVGVVEVEHPTVPAQGINVTVKNGVVHLRSGPGLSYGITADVSAGTVLTITGTTEADGMLWGKCDQGWISLMHTNYFDIVEPNEDNTDDKKPLQLPILATIIDPNGVTVYNGPHTTYPKLTTLAAGEVVLLEEYTQFTGREWVRYAGGWIHLTDTEVLIHDEYTLAHSFTLTSTAVLAIRQAPGVENEQLGKLKKGGTAVVYAIAFVDGTPWGRIPKGWVNLTYSDYDASLYTQYQSHTFGEWYDLVPATCDATGTQRRDCQACGFQETRVTEAGNHRYDSWQIILQPTCTESGQEQRSCTLCGFVDTREIAAPGHSFTAWEETKEATAQEPGEERRECTVCGYSETRQTAPSEHSFGAWQITEAPTCDAPGTERRECQTCDHYEEREVEPTGHSYGQWYVSLEPTVEEYGQEKRDCVNCDHFETRQLDKLPPPTITRTYAIVTCDALRIRSGPGTHYGQVGRLYKGTKVELLEIQTVDSTDWGRIPEGWICLTDFTRLETVVEGPHTEHTYGDWYELLAPTTTACGQERRDCTVCDHYEIREIPMLDGSVVTKVYATITCDSLTIRSGAGTSFARLGNLHTGVRIEILEQVTKNGVVWGLTDLGWIWLTGYATLETVTEAPNPESVTMTVNTDKLRIRTGAGSVFDICGYVYQGSQVVIYETVTVDGVVWARISAGWVMKKFLK